MVLPLILEFSSRLPVSVYGTGTRLLDRGFSRQRGFNDFGTCFSLAFVSRNCDSGFASIHFLPT